MPAADNLFQRILQDELVYREQADSTQPRPDHKKTVRNGWVLKEQPKLGRGRSYPARDLAKLLLLAEEKGLACNEALSRFRQDEATALARKLGISERRLRRGLKRLGRGTNTDALEGLVTRLGEGCPTLPRAMAAIKRQASADASDSLSRGQSAQDPTDDVNYDQEDGFDELDDARTVPSNGGGASEEPSNAATAGAPEVARLAAVEEDNDNDVNDHDAVRAAADDSFMDFIDLTMDDASDHLIQDPPNDNRAVRTSYRDASTQTNDITADSEGIDSAATQTKIAKLEGSLHLVISQLLELASNNFASDKPEQLKKALHAALNGHEFIPDTVVKPQPEEAKQEPGE